MNKNQNQNQNQNQNKNRSRGRNNNNRRGGPSRGSNFESNGPEVKVRGSAQQVLDKYLQLARDAQSSGDRINAEGYLQYAEHYYRIINSDSNLSTNPNQNTNQNHSHGQNTGNDDARHQSGGSYDNNDFNQSGNSGVSGNAAEESASAGDDGDVNPPIRQSQRNPRGPRPQRRDVVIEDAGDKPAQVSTAPKPRRERKEEAQSKEKDAGPAKNAKPAARRKPSSAASKEQAPA